MIRTFLFLAGAMCLAVAACSHHEAAPEPKQEADNSQPAAPVTVTAPIAASTPAPPKPAAPSPPVALASRLRELVAAYIVSDGRGGWRKDEKAATELEKLSADETEQIWPLLKDSEVGIRRGAAVYLLAQLNESDSRQVEAFTALLDDQDAFVRARALDAARQFLSADKIAALPKIAALLDAAREPRPENRGAAARICGAMKKDASGALSSIEKTAAADPDAKVRAAATTAAAQIAEPQDAVGLLKKALADNDGSVRVVAAARLRQLGRDAAPAAQDLAATLADADKDVAEAAAEALIRIGSPAVEPLADQLSGGNVAARKLALACLAKLGPAAKPAASQIAKCKQDPDAEVRQLAEVALKSTGSP